MIQFDVREPDKRRFLNAVYHRESAEVCFNEIEFHPHIVSKILGREFHCRSYDLPIEDHFRFIRCVGLDMCNIAVSWWLGREPYVDATGLTQYKMGTMRSREELDDIIPADLDEVERRIEALLEAAVGTRVGWSIAVRTSVSLVVGAMGFENYFGFMYDAPELIDEFIKRLDEYTFLTTQTVLKYKPDMIRISTYGTDKNGPMMKPEHFKRFVIEPLKPHLSLIASHGTPVMLHCDGNNSSLVEKWIELGCNILHPNEPCDGYKIEDTEKQWGDRITLAGGIDVQRILIEGNPSQIRDETLKYLSVLSSRGGYICGSSHDINNLVPVENLRAMAETVAHYRKYQSSS